MPTSLVTGGAGFIGSHIVNELINLRHKVIVLDDLSGGFIENVNKKALFIQGSVTDEILVGKIFNEYDFDYVYHLAAYAAEGLSHFIRRFNYNNNLIGSVNLINESIKHKIKCFVFTSSIAVYGAQIPPMKEENTPTPEDPYGIAKYAVEMDLKTVREMFDLNYIIFRPHNVYGEYQNIGDRYRNVVGIFMNQIMQGKSLTIFGDGEQIRAFSYIGDIAPKIAKSINIAQAYNKVFNIGADQNYTINELAIKTIEVFESKSEIIHLPARNEVVNAYSDHSKINSIFNGTQNTSLDYGLRKMAKWAKATGIKKSKKFQNIEIEEKVPSIWLQD